MFNRTIIACAALGIAVSLNYSTSAEDPSTGAEKPSTEFTERDQLRIAAQNVCPVSGKPLGSNGTPFRVRTGQEELFLCCEGCAGGKISREHWGTIHANFVSAQGRCPVMKHELPKNAKWTIVDGQIIYVCCPPCIDKINADPETYLTKLDDLYRASVGSVSRDQLRIAAQQICPVSGKELSDAETPIKARIGDEELFLCCDECNSGKVKRSHWETIHANLAKAQQNCPVMEKKLPRNPKWTIVNGRIIYVCCPPCIDKIQADPESYLAKVDKWYRDAPQEESGQFQ